AAAPARPDRMGRSLLGRDGRRREIPPPKAARLGSPTPDAATLLQVHDFSLPAGRPATAGDGRLDPGTAASARHLVRHLHHAGLFDRLLSRRLSGGAPP